MLGIDPAAARSAWSWVTVLALLAGLFVIRKTLLVFIIAVMFSYLLFPLVEFIYRRFSPKSRAAAALLPFLGILGFLAICGAVIRPQIANERDQLRSQLTNAHFRDRLEKWEVMGYPAGKVILDNEAHIVEMLPQGSVRTGLHATLRDSGNLVLIPILSFFFLRDGKRLRDTVVAILFGSEYHTGLLTKGRRTAESLLKDAHVLILEYMRALLLQCLATFIAYSIALKLLSVPYAILLALAAFPLEFVPLVGPLVSALLILGVCEFNLAMNPDKVPHLHFFAVLAFLAVYRIFQDYILSPALMKKGVKLHPLLIIFGVYAGGEIGGVGGIFLSVPLLALVRLLYFEWRKPALAAGDPVVAADPEPRGQVGVLA